MKEEHWKEGTLHQIELSNGDNMVVKVEGGFYYAPAWCRIHNKMEWLKLIEPINLDEVITILEMNDTVEEYEKYFIDKNRDKKIGLNI